MAEIIGTAGNDTITGTAAADVIYAGEGADKIVAGAGNDIVYGGLGNDNISGDVGDDKIYGEAGDDLLNGHAGRDEIYGGDGNDGVYGGGDADLIFGAAGNDVLIGDGGNDSIDGGAGNDKLWGGIGDDTLRGGAGLDILNGDAGNDTMIVRAGEGNDTLNGGLGLDTVVLDLAAGDVTAAFRAEVVAYNSWMQGLLATSGGTAGLAAQTTGATFNFSSIGVTMSVIEGVTIQVDGVAVPLSSFLNQAPVAGATASLTTNEDTAVNGQVIATDADGNTLTWTLGQGPANGTLTLNSATGQYVYTPGANYNGSDTFAVTVADTSGASVTQQVNVGVSAVNDAPVADGAVSISTDEDTAVSGQVAAFDVDGDVLSWSVSQGPAHGTLSLNASTGEYVYNAVANYSGADTFTVKVSDGSGGFTTQQASVSIAAVADAAIVTVADAMVTAGIVLNGTSGNDQLDGTSGNDFIYGGAGDDIIAGSGVAPVLSAALNISAALTDLDGSESLSIRISGVPADASLSAGTKDVDGSWSLTQGQLSGLSMTASSVGSYTLNVTATSLEASGETASASAVLNVTIVQGTDSDTLDGGAGNDKITGGAAADVIYAGDGADKIVAGAGNDIVYGGLGNDNISGDVGDDKIYGEAGDDLLNGHAGRDEIFGGDGNDRVYGGGENDLIFGGAGNDALIGDGGNDSIDGGDGDDSLNGNSGSDALYGGDGDDSLDGDSGSDTLYGGNGNDELNGGSGNDILYDGSGDDTVKGGSGDDYFFAGSGADKYFGGSGFDTVDYSGATVSITIDATNKTVLGFSNDTVDSIEKIIGSNFADTIIGGSSANMLLGAAGDDYFRGKGGADIFTGGAGSDTYEWFVKDVLNGKKHLGIDTITDFGAGDRLDLTEFTKSFKNAPIDSIVHLNDTAQGSMLSVKVGSSFVDLVMLEGVHDVIASDLLDDGMIVA